jgi:transcriptional regulator with XRE-family HTH domain
MAIIPPEAARVLKPFEVGLQVARGRKRAKISQAAFAQKLGVSRKTVSDLERGAAEHVSLKTAMAALSLAGFVLYSTERRPPSMEEIMAQRAADRRRVEKLLSTNSLTTNSQTSPAESPRRTQRRKRSA